MYLLKRADLRPRNFVANLVFWNTFLEMNDGRALFFIQRGLEAATVEDEEAYSPALAMTHVHASHSLRVQGDLVSLNIELDRLEEMLSSARGEFRAALANHLGFAYTGLGQIRRVGELHRQNGVGHAGHRLYLLREAAQRGAFDEAREAAEGLRSLLASRELAALGFVTEAREQLAKAEAEFEARGEPTNRVLGLGGEVELTFSRGVLALAEGRTPEAVSLLEAFVESREQRVPAPLLPAYYYFRACDWLATALQRLGREEEARLVLEKAARQKLRAGVGGRVSWLRVRLSLAELYRDMGREEDAIPIEDDLRHLLAYADRDFWLLRRLEDGTPDPWMVALGP